MSLQFEGRTYVLGTVDGIALTCDRCESSIATGAQVWSCAAFDHDICTRCRPSEAADPMDDGEEDAGEDAGEEDLTPEEQASKQRRIEAAIGRQQRLLANTKDWVDPGRRRGEGEDDGEEGGDGEPDEAA